MTPSFALSLSSEGVALLRQQPAGWAQIAEAPFGEGDPDAAMAGLRARAEALSPEGRRVLLVIPNDQIRYLDLADPGEDAATREAAIRGALDGATPYALDDLAYDWTASNGRLLAAATAWETLQEAEAFALQYGFEPAAFVASAPHGSFIGSVDFGRAAAWQGPAPDRLPRAIRVIPADEAALRPEPRPIPPAPRTEEAAQPAAQPIGILDPGPTPETEARAPPASEPPATAPDPQPAPDSQVPDSKVPDSQVPGTRPAPEPRAPETPPHVVLSHEIAGPLPLSGVAPLAPLRPAAPATAPAEAPATKTPGTPAPKAAAAPPLPPTASTPQLPPDPKTAAQSLRRRFTPIPQPDQSLREAGVTGGTLDGAEDDAATAAAATASPQRRALSFLSRRDAAPTDTPDPDGALGKLRTRRRGTGKKTPARAAPALSAADRPAAKPSVPGAGAPPAGDPPATGAVGTAPGHAPAAPAPQTESTGPGALSRAEELERMTLFGARNRERRPALPMGLIATAAGVIALAALAGWASVHFDDRIAALFGGDDTSVAALTAPETVESTPSEPTAATDPAVAPEPASEPAATDPELQPEPEETAPAGTAPRRLGQDEAAATYAATGIWQRAPNGPLEPAPTLLGDVYVASIDPDVTQQDAVALPAPGDLVQETALPDPGLTPPPGMVFDLDDRGLVRPSPDGTRAPAGHSVFTGPPPAVPPQRDPAPDPPPQDTAPQEDAAGALPPLGEIRPEARPGDLVESRERATLGGLSREELAEIRPVLRPATAQEEAAAADPAASATERAIGASLVPVGRPRNMAAIVDQADNAIVQQAAAPAPQPAVPQIPSNANVAREATVTNALNLRETNLIGVYGTQDNRRALVRLPNGSYQKVQVGDRIDGGRVAAIGEAELRYVKGGRNITLNMPRG